MEESDVQETEKESRRNLSLLSLTALGLSMAALLVSVFEVSAIREDQRVQVWPYIEVSTNYSENGYALTVENKGIGPARIRSAALLFDGQPVTSLDQLILETLGPEDAFSYDLYKSNDPNRSVMSPDETVVLFSVPWEDRTLRLNEAWSGRVGVSVCYCSVYDECWLAALDGGEPEVITHCDNR